MLLQPPLLRLAERCRVGLDADVADMQRRAADSGQQPRPGGQTSAWAAPLGLVMQVRHAGPDPQSCTLRSLAYLTHQ